MAYLPIGFWNNCNKYLFNYDLELRVVLLVPQSISRLVLYYTICRIADMSEEFNLTLTAKNPSVNF